jgi:hypothetical protein
MGTYTWQKKHPPEKNLIIIFDFYTPESLNVLFAAG